MLRELQVTKDKPANSMYKAEADVVTGMAVVKADDAFTFKLPEADDTAADLFFVDKERVPSGWNTSRGDMSDYDEDFVNVKKDEFAKLIAYYPGERFATDQIEESSLVAGDRLAAGTDGKLKKATAATSKYIFRSYWTDCGHKLGIVEVSDTASTGE